MSSTNAEHGEAEEVTLDPISIQQFIDDHGEATHAEITQAVLNRFTSFVSTNAVDPDMASIQSLANDIPSRVAACLDSLVDRGMLAHDDGLYRVPADVDVQA